MLKSILSLAVVGSVAMISVSEASACGGRCGCARRTCCTPAPTCCAAPSATTTDPVPPPTTDVPPPAPTAMNGNGQYRSYSYDSMPATGMTSTQTYRYPTARPKDIFRADHKIRGL